MKNSLRTLAGATAVWLSLWVTLLLTLILTQHLAAQSDNKVYLPALFKSLPAPVLNAINRSNSSNSWTLSWNEPGSGITNYQIQESPDTAFTAPILYNVGTALANTFSYSASPSNVYCYRVRAEAGNLASEWSNARCVTGDYHDNFADSASGWSIRRQDTDDIKNSSYYESEEFVVKIGGRWDYAIASPLVQTPNTAYRLETQVKFDDGVDNLHGYGVIFGGDWNGQTCPNSAYTSCFNHYYRLLVIWFGAPEKLRVSLKRIDSHDPSDNAGRGVTLLNHRDVSVNRPGDWNTWGVEVQPNGDITILLNGQQIAQVNDSTYINDRYFGVMAVTDEYLGAEPHFDWYSVKAIP